jgi:hypothetical protein
VQPELEYGGWVWGGVDMLLVYYLGGSDGAGEGDGWGDEED